MNEFRRAKRRRVPETIELFDTMTEQVVGRIGNLSETGMLALTSVPLVDDALYQLRFALIDRHGRRHEMEVGAHQLWSDPANVAGQCWSGFRFIEMAREDNSLLREWVEEPGGEYA
jgi:hypothetical protein